MRDSGLQVQNIWGFLLLNCPLPFHLTSLRPSTIILYLVISFATCAAFPTYRVMMFQLPILEFALIDRGFVGELASCWLSPAHVVSSSCKPSSGYWSRSRCSVSVALCFFYELGCYHHAKPAESEDRLFSARVFLPLVTCSGYLKALDARLSPLSHNFRGHNGEVWHVACWQNLFETLGINLIFLMMALSDALWHPSGPILAFDSSVFIWSRILFVQTND